MAYFQYFPKTLYSTNKEGTNLRIIPNLTTKVSFLQSVVDNESSYFKYQIKGGETPEQIAYRVYGDPEKHWIILLANQLIDPQFDWALGPSEFDKHIKQKYASLNISLKTTESYPIGYTVGEKVYQGSSYDRSDVDATVVAYDSGTKTLQVKFPSQVLANGNTITGVSSAQTHTIVAITNNEDGYQWASNTTNYYKVRETKTNSGDPTNPEIIEYKVSAVSNVGNVQISSYNFTSHTVQTSNAVLSYSNTYSLSDGTTLTVATVISPVSYFDYEVDLNESRRSIIVPKSSVAVQIESQFINLMA
jgi:hypothetical protein